MELSDLEMQALKRFIGYFCSKDLFVANIDAAIETTLDESDWIAARDRLMQLCPDD